MKTHYCRHIVEYIYYMLIWPAAGVFEIFHTIYIVEKTMIKLRKKVEIPTNYFYYF